MRITGAINRFFRRRSRTEQAYGTMTQFDGREINYKIFGRSGPWVAAIQGGRIPLESLNQFALSVAERGCRVVLHDPRNCGLSSLDFDSTEDAAWTADFNALLDHLGAKPAIVLGKSRGARIAVRLALGYPNAVRGLCLWGLSGGPTAIRFLDEFYYGKYLRAAYAGGMEAVCATDHFAALIKARPEILRLLLEMPAGRFIEAMSRWRSEFLIASDHAVFGISDEELGRIHVPTALVPYYDKLHPHASLAHAHRMILNSHFYDFEPARRDAPKMDPKKDSSDQRTSADLLCNLFFSRAA